MVGAKSKPWTPALIPQGECRRCQTSFLPPLGEQSPSGWATQLMALLIAIVQWGSPTAGIWGMSQTKGHGAGLRETAERCQPRSSRATGLWGWHVCRRRAGTEWVLRAPPQVPAWSGTPRAA